MRAPQSVIMALGELGFSPTHRTDDDGMGYTTFEDGTGLILNVHAAKRIKSVSMAEVLARALEERGE
jgi:hypothetical protein